MVVGGRKAEGGRKEGREGRGRERGEGGVQNKTNQGERKLKESSCWERQSRQQAGRQAGDETNTHDALDTSPSSGGGGGKKKSFLLHFTAPGSGEKKIRPVLHTSGWYQATASSS